MAVKFSQSLKQSLKQTQGLAMTPQLQQAIKLLTLTHMEMTNLISQEMVENPMLEEVGEGPRENREDYSGEALENLSQEATPESFERSSILKNYLESTDPSESPSSPSSKGGSTENQMDYENIASSQKSLADHLLWQVRMGELLPEEFQFVESVIHNMNDNGHLDCPLQDLLSQTPLSSPRAQELMELIQRLDPVGCGTESLEDSLLVQAQMAGQYSPLLKKMVRKHLKDLQSKSYEKIAKACGVDINQVKATEEILQEFHPHPGRLISSRETHYVVPDVYVVKIGSEYVVQVNDDGVPRLRINNLYRSMLKREGSQYKKAQDFVQEKLRSALWLIKSIQNRQRTIEKVAKAIVRRQQEFFRLGPRGLKPMILKDIAQEIGMHESTVSRVTNNKYMHTPLGPFELKYFFSAGIGGKNGGMDVSSESLRLKIKSLIEGEDPRRPFSDQKIVSLLDREGLQVARRTVAKYRESLGFLSSARRKAS